MFIIFGTKGRLTNVSPGETLPGACRSCSGDLVLKENKTWFTFLFIPLYPISSRGKYYVCNRCTGVSKIEVKEYPIRVG